MDRPHILVLDDGELDRIAATLERLGLEPLRVSGDEVRDGLPMPSDLLITSGRRTREMPALQPCGGGAPTWICVHTQDFGPLRERLRERGVHFLVQSSIEDRALEVFIAQLLHTGRERRAETRLPVGCEAAWSWKRAAHEKATLLDLSTRGARLVVDREVPHGAVITLHMPRQIVGAETDFTARAVRCAPAWSPDDARFELVVRWEGIDADWQQVLEAIAEGRRIGPRVAPLAPRPYVDGTGIPDWEELSRSAERRRSPRRALDRHVDAFGCDGSGPVAGLALDVSPGGLRLKPCGRLTPGDDLTLALHLGGRNEPLLLPAQVQRRDADGSLALVFGSLDDPTRDTLAAALDRLPELTSLSQDEGRVVPVELLDLAELAKGIDPLDE